MIKKKRDDLWKCLFSYKEYACFQWLWAPCGVPKREKHRVGSRSGFKLVFMEITESFGESLWEPKSFKHRCGFRLFLLEDACFGFVGGARSKGGPPVAVVFGPQRGDSEGER